MSKKYICLFILHVCLYLISNALISYGVVERPKLLMQREEMTGGGAGLTDESYDILEYNIHSKHITDELIIEAANSATLRIRVYQGDTLFQTIKEDCYKLTDDYLNILRNKISEYEIVKNIGLDNLPHYKFKEDIFLNIPYCFPHPEYDMDSVVVKPGDTLWDYYERSKKYEEFTWQEFLDSFHASNKDKYRNVISNELITGDKVKIPYKYVSDIIYLVPQDSNEFISKLKRTSSNDHSVSTNPTLGEHINELTDAEFQMFEDKECRNSIKPENITKFININSLLEILSINQSIHDSYSIGELSKVKILIGDTGLVGFGKYPFTDDIVQGNIGLHSLEDKIRRISADTRYPYYHHGTNVASIAMGGPDFIRINNLIKEPIYINFEKIIEAKTHPDNKIVFITPENKLTKFSKNADSDSNTFIINLSVRYFDYLSDFEDVIDSKRRSLLFIFAAGNSGYNLRTKTSFPANFGGDNKSNVLSVAALDWSDNISDFSNHSNEFIDISAPGCGVEVLEYEDNLSKYVPKLKSGTSFAAPFVSFAAALIKREASYMSPENVKRRLIYSSDLLHKNEKYVKDGRKLNLEKAVSIFFDYIELTSGQKIFGKVDFVDEEATPTFCDISIDRYHLKKVSRYNGSNYFIYHEKKRDQYKSDILNEICIVENKKLMIDEYNKDKIHNINLSDVKDIVFASVPYWKN